MTDAYAAIANFVYTMPWDLLPIEVRKKLPAIIATAQRPVYLKGFIRAQCTFEFLKNVILISIIVNYFIAIRSI